MIAEPDLPPRWPGVLARYRAREISAPIALAQLLLAGSGADVGDRLATLPGFEDLAALARTHAASIERLPALVAELGGAFAGIVRLADPETRPGRARLEQALQRQVAERGSR